jgi:hypothetical protein
MPRLYNKGQLPLELSFEMAVKSRKLIVRHSPADKNMGMEAEDPLLGNNCRRQISIGHELQNVWISNSTIVAYTYGQ